MNELDELDVPIVGCDTSCNIVLFLGKLLDDVGGILTDLYIAMDISPSGETVDTLAILRLAREKDYKAISV